MDKYNVYVLKSLRNDKRYVGMTKLDPKERLVQHNEGVNKFTRSNKPWILIYYEKGYCKDCAGGREKFLKSGQGREFLYLIMKSRGVVPSFAKASEGRTVSAKG